MSESAAINTALELVWLRRMVEECSHGAERKEDGNSQLVTKPDIDDRFRFTRGERLRGFGEFKRLLRTNRTVSHNALRCYYDVRHQIPPYICQVGFTIQRGGRGSVSRNALRRKMREAYRQNKSVINAMCKELSVNIRMVFFLEINSAHDDIASMVQAVIMQVLAELKK